MNELINGKYRYFAFICYTHADHSAAEKIYKKLQHYKLPNRLMNKEGCVKRLVPVFWDHRDLYGTYRDADRKALGESKFLIVICSKSLHEHDEEVNQEITDFLAAGNSVKNIIPFIVNYDVKPELNCFPAKLREICQEETIIGHNIFERGGKENYRAALLKTVALMQDISVSELENEDQRRRRWLMRVRLLMVAMITMFTITIYHVTATTRFDSELNLFIRYENDSGWEKELNDARVGDIVQLQVEFVNSRGFLSAFLSKYADSNDLEIKTDNIMLRSVLPDNLVYIENSTILYNSKYKEGVTLLNNTVTTTGINIGNYMINGNAYVRFNCRVIDNNLQEGSNRLIVWASSTIKEKVEKDSASVWVQHEK